MAPLAPTPCNSPSSCTTCDGSGSRCGPPLTECPHGLPRRSPGPNRRRLVRRPHRGRRHQRRRGGGVAGRPWCIGRAGRSGRLRLVHQSGVVEPGVGRVQVPRALRVPTGVQALPIPESVDEGLPRQHQGDRLPRQPRRDRAVRAVVRRARGVRVLGYRPVRHPSPPRAAHRDHRDRGAGHQHRLGARWHRVPRRLPHRQRRPLRVLVRPLGHRGRRLGRQLRRAGGSEATRRPVEGRTARHRQRRHATPARRGSSSTPPVRSSMR